MMNATPIPAVHPKRNEHGATVSIRAPSSASGEATWFARTAVAVFTPGSSVPSALNDVAVAPWVDGRPQSELAWASVSGQCGGIVGLPALKLRAGKKAASGVIVPEADGRVWLVGPTNGFGGVTHTFPKGTLEGALSHQANAIKECFEETGLRVAIDAFALDVERSTSVVRYFLAHRTGGSPADMGWESQAVLLAPLSALGALLNRPEDQAIIAFLRERAGRV